jgi:hypothetical protein
VAFLTDHRSANDDGLALDGHVVSKPNTVLRQRVNLHAILEHHIAAEEELPCSSNVDPSTDEHKTARSPHAQLQGKTTKQLHSAIAGYGHNVG